MGISRLFGGICGMIKAESIKDIRPMSDGCYKIKCKVETSIPDDLGSVAEEVFTAELVSIFKQLERIDPEILLDALEVYKEELKND